MVWPSLVFSFRKCVSNARSTLTNNNFSSIDFDVLEELNDLSNFRALCVSIPSVMRAFCNTCLQCPLSARLG